jgi:hypothetical protein
MTGSQAVRLDAPLLRPLQNISEQPAWFTA